MPRFLLPSILVLALPCFHPSFLLAAPLPGRGEEKVALVDAIKFNTNGIPKTIHERERFYETLRRNLDARGWTTIEPVADRACGGAADCLPAVARYAAAAHALRLTGEGNLKYGYTIGIELYSTKSSGTQRTTAFCDICNTDRMAGITADFAEKLLLAAVKEAEVAKTPPPEPSAKDAQPAENTPDLAAESPTAATPPSSSTPRWAPWILTGVGVAAMVYGGWALSKNGDSSGSPYSSSPSTYVHDTYSTKPIGLSCLIAGGLLAAAGVVWAVYTPTYSAAVSASPSSVALSVRY